MLQNLYPMFDSNDITFVADQDSIFDYFMSRGQRIRKYHKNMIFPRNTVCIQSSAEHFLDLEDNQDALINQDAKILRIPLIVFGNDYDSFMYTFEQLLRCDLIAMFDLKDRLLSKFEENNWLIAVNTSSSSKVICKFGEDAKYKYPSEILIDNGTTRSIAEYLEVSFDYNPRTPHSFHLDGDFDFKSCVYAILPNQDKITEEQKEQARFLCNEVSNAELCNLKIMDNHAVSLSIDDKEYIHILQEIVGTDFGLRVTEFAFGLNQNLFPVADWSYNSQLNEGCSGVHIGFSDAKSGIHIDFISPSLNVLDMVGPCIYKTRQS